MITNNEVFVLKITHLSGKVITLVYSTEIRAMAAHSLAHSLGAATELRRVYADTNNEGCVLDSGRNAEN